ncbi:MAG: glycosyltransferase family 2 protein [Oscillospiraceae bacterium]|nr:glycosyltransferase family 2 protein [Oscillospiraceae bacterium]
MKYSIIIPVFHSEKTISHCIDSFLNQSVSEKLEILCIGDKVDDPCHSVIEKYVRDFPDVVGLHLQSGRGIGGARNLGLDLAKGEYVMFSDADDYVSPFILEKCTDALVKYDADFITTGFVRVNQSGKKLSSELKVQDVCAFDLTPVNVPRLAFIFTAPWGKLFKREFIGESRFTDDPICAYEDLMFHMSVYPKAKRYVMLPETLYNYIVYEESSISTASEERTLTFRRDLAELKQKYINDRLPAEYLKMLDIVAMIHAGIADAHRSAEDPSVNLREFCKDAKDYLDESFPGWRKIKMMPYGKFTLRCKMVWIAKNMYKANVFWVFIRFYNWVIKNLHIDMKW